MKKLVAEKYYGRRGKNAEVNPYKGTLFEKCSLPYELFNVNRMVKMNSKQMLSRMGFLALRDGSIELQAKNKPEVADLKQILTAQSLEYELPQFSKPDFFAPFPFVEGVISADTYKTQGIKVKCLGDKMIFPLYGVWTPTTQEYLDLTANYMRQTTNTFQSYSSMADLGSGTGVLGILASQVGGFKGRIFSFDNQAACVESSKMNAQVFGLAEKVKTVEIDLVEFY
jgi:hypothetical protein